MTIEFKKRLRSKIFLRCDRYEDWVFRTSKPDWMYLPEWVNYFFCFFLEHTYIPDQCGNPDHDYCFWCGRPKICN